MTKKPAQRRSNLIEINEREGGGYVAVLSLRDTDPEHPVGSMRGFGVTPEAAIADAKQELGCYVLRRMQSQ